MLTVHVAQHKLCFTGKSALSLLCSEALEIPDYSTAAFLMLDHGLMHRAPLS